MLLHFFSVQHFSRVYDFVRNSEPLIISFDFVFVSAEAEHYQSEISAGVFHHFAGIKNDFYVFIPNHSASIDKQRHILRNSVRCFYFCGCFRVDYRFFHVAAVWHNDEIAVVADFSQAVSRACTCYPHFIGSVDVVK